MTCLPGKLKKAAFCAVAVGLLLAGGAVALFFSVGGLFTRPFLAACLSFTLLFVLAAAAERRRAKRD